jgi:hypothetical protein
MSAIPGISGSGSASTSTASPRAVPLAIALGVVICIAGGFLTGFLLTRHVVFGAILMGVGWVAGFVSRKVTGTASRFAGQCLVAACFLAFCIAMVSWYRWGLTVPDGNGGFRDPTWTEAIKRAPDLLLVRFGAPTTLLISGLCAAFGAAEAFRLAGRRYRLVAVEEE